jgi:2-(3-amino-3-carboxypropyl)histidine synthase
MKIDLKDIEKKYNFELNKIVSEIKKKKCKFVLLQFPDGLKPYATTIVDFLREKTKAEFFIWIGSCYGACDTPTGIEKIKPEIDLVIQFGHNEMMPSY